MFGKHNARITAVSTEQSVRGLRHNQHRPDLIIGDDLEDIASTKTREGRNKTYEWLTGEVIPAGDRGTRLIVIGNLLHEDSLIMRLREDIEGKRIPGVFKAYPLLEAQTILWPGKYPTMDDIDEERQKAANEYAWQREYLLNIVPAEDQVIDPAWIQYYDEIPPRVQVYRDETYMTNLEVRIGVDLAISKRDTADYTTMVPALLYERSKGYDIYILPKIINKRLSFPETVETCKVVNDSYKSIKEWNGPVFVIEDVAYQSALPQQLKAEGITRIHTVKPGNADKRTRLMLTANLIKTGAVKFPREGAEQLIQQIVHFGVEKHDDLADAFSALVLDALADPPRTFRIFML